MWVFGCFVFFFEWEDKYTNSTGVFYGQLNGSIAFESKDENKANSEIFIFRMSFHYKFLF